VNILNEILSARNGATVEQLANQFGLGQDETRNAVASLLPALSAGIRRNATSGGGLESLLGALTKGQHERYLDDPKALSAPGAIDDGNNILGHILGNKETSRQVADQAAQTTGVSATLLKQLLPVVAGLAMGALSKRTASGDLRNQLTQNPGADLGELGSFLDMDGDGQIADDILNFARKLF